MVLTLDNDFAAVRSDFTDHLFCGLAVQEGNKVASVSFRLTGWAEQSSIEAWASTAAS
jgi:hypothetical protein